MDTVSVLFFVFYTARAVNLLYQQILNSEMMFLVVLFDRSLAVVLF